MAFETKRIYRAANGHELKTIMSQRVLAAMQEDNALNMARAFPLLRYEVRVKLTPYHQAGPNDVHADADINYEIDGCVYIPSNTEPALELVETSPIYGKEADPQELRKLAEQGTVETAYTNTGEKVDVRTRPGTAEPPEMPPAVITQPQSWPAEKPEPPPPVDERPEDTLAAEEARWRNRRDPEVERATSIAVRNFEEAGEIKLPKEAAGRVSIIRSAAEGGGSEHGKPRR
jgi:hypothetical protein